MVSRPAGDGPSAIARWTDNQQKEWIVIAHAYARELWLVPADAPGSEPPRILAAPASATALVISKEGIAYLAEHARDTVWALKIKDW